MPLHTLPKTAVSTIPSDLGVAARLSQSEQAEAELVARRLHSELKACIALLPERDQGGSAMSRVLGLDRATCQRLVATTASPNAEAETLVHLPGVLGLKQFLAAMWARTSDPRGVEQLQAAAAAVNRFESLIKQLGGSQRKLRARLASTRAGNEWGAGSAAAASDDIAAREAMFRAAAALTGRWSETSISLSLIRPTPADEARDGSGRSVQTTQTARIRAVLGHHARADAVPLEVGSTNPLEAEPSRSDPVRHRAPAMLLEEFCSRPMPRLVSHTTGHRVVHVIDAAEPGAIENADIVLADREPVTDLHPAVMKPPVGEVWSLINFPSRLLVFDVFLHRDIAARCRPSLELHMWTPNVVQHAAARWSTRFPGGPRLRSLGNGLTGARTTGYGRYLELVGQQFARLGWDAESFVGYRCEVAFPVWRAGYCVAFDFGARQDGPPA
ncbi:MAG: hypothetical protein ACK4WH_04880 [Phycisphaerales bacterium]